MILADVERRQRVFKTELDTLYQFLMYIKTNPNTKIANIRFALKKDNVTVPVMEMESYGLLTKTKVGKEMHINLTERGSKILLILEEMNATQINRRTNTNGKK